MDPNPATGQGLDTDLEDRYAPTYLDLAKLDEAGSPKRHSWAVEDWLRMGTTTLMLGENDAYKSIFVQQLETALASECDHFVSTIPERQRVLAWMVDDEDELLRRQRAISERLGIPSGSLADRLFLASTADTVDCAFLAKVQGRLVPTPTLKELREKIGDLKIGVVVLENVAKTFGGNEHERHDVMAYLAALGWAGNPPTPRSCLSMLPRSPRASSQRSRWRMQSPRVFGFPLVSLESQRTRWPGQHRGSTLPLQAPAELHLG
jgi:AAA domain-containing protein